ncbi:MAG TPA: type I methionyl aminopeptidase [Candidatus Angelobacter sp.]|nr:type I methionyl aminopeptidase [Candidatus Angelobacter sp.]
MIHLKEKEEIILIRKSAILASKTLGMISSEIKPGINTLYLDRLAREFIQDYGGIPAFLGLYGFSHTICVSPNEQVVHGIPNNKPLLNGDIISIDCGVFMNNFYSDQAYTFEVGEVSFKAKRLLKITKESLYLGIKSCIKGNFIGDIGYAIQNYVENNGFTVVKEFTGHGLGRKIHEPPLVPNYGKIGKGNKLNDGLVLAIEPMVNEGTNKIKFHTDRWTVSTLDKKLSAHFEHNVAIIDGFPRLLSTFKYIYEVLNIESSEEEIFAYNNANNTTTHKKGEE